LFEEKDLEKELKAVDVDLALDIADKVENFLDKSLKKPFERYMVARLVSILYEETLDCSFKPELEAYIENWLNKSQRKQRFGFIRKLH
jgi:hypothetical protein